MDTCTQSVSGGVVGPAKSPKRSLRTIAEKRQIVKERMLEGASVARIARAHGVNANQVSSRMLYRKGRLGAATLLPGRVTSESLSLQAPLLRERTCAKSVSGSGTTQVELRLAQVRIEGSADPAVLRVCCWSVCGCDRTARQYVYLDCSRRDRPATRVHGPERAPANQAAAKSDVRSCVCVSGASRRSD